MIPSRTLPWLIAAAALAGGLGLYLGQHYFAAQHAQAPATRSALVYPQPRPLADFQLQRTDDQPLTLTDWQGHWSLVFIGFTHCPDACPQTLALFRDIDKAWPADAGAKPVQYFVSVDPERDDDKILADYARYFSANIVAASGSHAQLQAFTRQLGMVYTTRPLPTGDYTVDHSTHLAVIDPQARMVAMFRTPLDAQAIVADLTLLRSGAGTP